MIIYITDRRLNILGKASTIKLENTPVLIADAEIEEVSSGITTFSGTIIGEKSNVEVGNYILYADEDKRARYFTILTADSTRSDNSIDFYAEDAGLDLLNERYGPIIAGNQSFNIEWYIELVVGDSGFEIGTVDDPTITKSINWDDEKTVTERLIDICAVFNVEMYFSFKIQDMKITHKYINITKRRGTDSGVTLRYPKDISEIKVSKSILNLATALIATGGTPSGANTPINLKGYIYDDGRFYIDAGSGLLKDRESLRIWSRYLSETGTGEGHIVSTFKYDTVSKPELVAKTIERLKVISEAEINYNITLNRVPENIRLGDTIRIVDSETSLLLSARVLKLTRNRSMGNSSVTLGNYLVLKNEVSLSLRELADRVAALRDGTDAVFGYLTSDSVTLTADANGNVTTFEPASGEFKMVKGATFIPNSDVIFEVTETSGCVGSINTDGEYSVTVMNSDSAWLGMSASYGEIVVAKRLSLSKSRMGSDGEDGVTLYTWIKYADDISGTGISSDPLDKPVIGFAYNKTTNISSDNPEDYTWSWIQGEDGIAGVNGVNGLDGENAVSGYLTKDTVALPTSSDGVVESFATATGTFVMFDGTENVSSQAVNSVVSTINCTANIDNATGIYAVTAMTADYATAIFKAVYNGIEIQKIFSVAKVRDGEAGVIVSDTPPEAPTVGQIWQDSSVTPNVQKKWSGSEWVINVLSASNISAETLSAITANLGEVTAGVMTNSDGTFIIDLSNGFIKGNMNPDNPNDFLLIDLVNGRVESISDTYNSSTIIDDGYIVVSGKDPGTNHSNISIGHDIVLTAPFTNPKQSAHIHYEYDDLYLQLFDKDVNSSTPTLSVSVKQIFQMYLDTTKLKSNNPQNIKTYQGSEIRTAAGYQYVLFKSLAQVQAHFGADGVGKPTHNFTMLATNGDWSAFNGEFTSFWSGTNLYVGFSYKHHTGAVRINYTLNMIP